MEACFLKFMRPKGGGVYDGRIRGIIPREIFAEIVRGKIVRGHNWKNYSRENYTVFEAVGTGSLLRTNGSHSLKGYYNTILPCTI